MRHVQAVTFAVIAEPSRREILDLLRGGERPVHELVEELGLSQPAVSKHLRVLRDAGLVEVRPDAQRRLYRLRPEPLVELDEWLGPDPRPRGVAGAVPPPLERVLRPARTTPRGEPVTTDAPMPDGDLIILDGRPALRFE